MYIINILLNPRMIYVPTHLNKKQGCTLAVARSQMRPENRPCDLGFLSGRRPCDQLFGALSMPTHAWLHFNQKGVKAKMVKRILFHTNLAIKH